MNYAEEYNLPLEVDEFPYPTYIKQLPYTYKTDDRILSGEGRKDLTKTFKKENNKWVPM